MDIVYSKEFIKSAQVIPKHIQRKLADSLEFVKRDPFHLVLHAKPLSGVLKGFYSFRVTRDWRVIFYFPRWFFLSKLRTAKIFTNDE